MAPVVPNLVCVISDGDAKRHSDADGDNPEGELEVVPVAGDVLKTVDTREGAKVQQLVKGSLALASHASNVVNTGRTYFVRTSRKIACFGLMAWRRMAE